MLDRHMTMMQAFQQVAEPRRSQLALVYIDMRLTYGELLDRSNRLAAGLRQLGLKKGDRVVACLSPGPNFVSLFFALAKLGGVMVPQNPQVRPYSLSQVLQDADPLILVIEHPLKSELSIRPPSLKHILMAAGNAGKSPTLEDLASPASASMSASTEPLSQSQISTDDLLALLYTSGTTGAPKGTMHTHKSLITPVIASLLIRDLWLKNLSLKSIGQSAKAIARYKTRLLRLAGKPMTFLSTVPWHSITGIELMLQGLLMGDIMVVMPRFHPRQALELVEREKVSILVAIPTAFQVMLSLEDFDRYNTSSLLICGTGAAPCPPELARQIQERFGCALHIGFGSTETAGGIAIPSLADSDELQATTVGRPLPGMEVRILDDAGQEVPAGQVGELVCRSESIMLGYYSHPDATSEVIDQDGWYFTGDLARFDAAGYLHIVGRKRDMIIRGGQNIYPAEIEAYLASHPDILEAAVIGVPSALSGEEVWACIILRPGAQLSSQQVLDYCRAALEPYKIPAHVRFMTDFPRSESGKPQKFRLQSDIITELTHDHTGKETII